MKKLLTLLVLFIFIAVFSQKQDFKKLDDFFHSLEKNHKVMGSFAIADNDKIVYSNAIGFADVSSKRKADVNTVYRIGSISKTFTSVLIMMAVEEKKLKVEDRLSTFYPEIKNADKITIENLLQHRSGIHNFTDDPEYFTYNTQFFSEKKLLDKFAQKIDFEPNTAYQYSNSNYVLLALILQKIYKKSYASLIQEKISKPLHLKFTKVGEKIDVNNNIANSYIYSNEQYEKSTETDMSIPIGAGNIVSTPSELLQFILALGNGKLITKESLSKMQSYKDHYGYGIFEVPFYNKKGFGHNGGIDEFQSVLYYFPDGKQAFAMITNQSNYDNNQISINALKSINHMDFEIPNFETITVKDEILKTYVGTYTSKEFPLKIAVFLEEGTLKAQATGQSSFPLHANSEDTFTFDLAGITMKFNPKDQSMLYTQMGQRIVFTKE